jgi:hypothetical protein
MSLLASPPFLFGWLQLGCATPQRNEVSGGVEHAVVDGHVSEGEREREREREFEWTLNKKGLG